MNDKQRKIIEEHFNIYEYEDDYDIEAWTDGGVDMIININNNEDIVTSLKDYCDNFDIDEEIDLYRQDKNYKENFTIRESIKDFERWLDFIKKIIKKLEEINRGE